MRNNMRNNKILKYFEYYFLYGYLDTIKKFWVNHLNHLNHPPFTAEKKSLLLSDFRLIAKDFKNCYKS